MSARITAFFVWAAVAACAVFWVLNLLVTPRPVPPQAQPVGTALVARGDVARLFAVAAPQATVNAPTQPALASRFKLLGVMAPKDSERGRGQGVALIAVDDKPARAYRVGARVDQTLVLQSVAQRSAVIGPAQGAPAVKLDLPLPTPPATGNLPPATALLAPEPASVIQPVIPAPTAVPPPGPAPSVSPAAVLTERALSGAASDPANRR